MLFFDEKSHEVVTTAILAHVACTDNRQLKLILKYIVQRYVLNLPRMCFSVGCSFILSYFHHVLARLEWMNPLIAQSFDFEKTERDFETLEKAGNIVDCFATEAMFCTFLYRKCGISAFFHQKTQFSIENIEEARAAIVIGNYLDLLYMILCNLHIIDLNRKVVASLAAIFSVSDILSVEHANAEREKGKKAFGSTLHSPQKSRYYFLHFVNSIEPFTYIFRSKPDAYFEDEEDAGFEARDQYLKIRRDCVNEFIFGSGRDTLAAILLDTTLRCLKIPDQTLIGKVVRIFRQLCSEQQAQKVASEAHVSGWSDERIAVYFGTSVFGTCLHMILRDEKLLNSDILVLLEDILTRFEPLASRINQCISDTHSSATEFTELDISSIPPCVALANFRGSSKATVASMCSVMCTKRLKKSRKDALRDVIADIIREGKGQKYPESTGITNVPILLK